MKTAHCNEMMGGVIGELACSVTGYSEPPLVDWTRLMRLIEMNDVKKILVYTAVRGALSSEAKTALFDMLGRLAKNNGRPVIVSLVLQSHSPIIVRFANAMAALHRKSVDLKVFDASTVEPALSHLELSSDQLQIVRVTMDEWCGALKVGRVFGLPGAVR